MLRLISLTINYYNFQVAKKSCDFFILVYNRTIRRKNQMTINQKKMLENQAKMNGFSFETELKIGQLITKLNELEQFDYRTQNKIIDNIINNKYQIMKKELTQDEIMLMCEQHNKKINKLLKKEKIKDYKEWLNRYQNADKYEWNVEPTAEKIKQKIAFYQKKLEELSK